MIGGGVGCDWGEDFGGGGRRVEEENRRVRGESVEDDVGLWCVDVCVFVRFSVL